MLAKLIKYDFRSIKRFGVPVIITLLVATVLGTVNMLVLVSSINNMQPDAEVPFLRSLLLLGSWAMMFLCFALVSLATVGMQVLICVDFYKSLVSDEAYLTFTLPVKAQDILRSKLINAFIWTLIVSAAAILSVCIMVFVGIVPLVGWEEFVAAFELGPIPLEIVFDLGVMTVLGILLSLISIVNGLLLYFMAIFFASVIARKHKILTAIACVYGVNMIYSILSAIAMPIVSVFGTLLGVIFSFGADPTFGVINVTLFLGCILLTGMNILFYYLTKHMMEKKLNLP